jgi:hypothetical protein
MADFNRNDTMPQSKALMLCGRVLPGGLMPGRKTCGMLVFVDGKGARMTGSIQILIDFSRNRRLS